MANSGLDKSIAKTTGVAFLSILLALILKSALDTFFGPAHSVKDVRQIWKLVRVDPVRRCLLVVQGMVFLVTLVRFYLGAYRYYQERADDTAHSAIRDFTGQIFVFISFYLAAVLIKTVGLFYIAVLIIHIVDGVWFFLAARSEDKPTGTKLVASTYLRFDVMTVAIILAGAVPATKWPTSFYFWQFLCLLILFLLGCWDFKSLWPFYNNEPDWQDRIRLWRCALPMLPKPSVGLANRPESPTQM